MVDKRFKGASGRLGQLMTAASAAALLSVAATPGVALAQTAATPATELDPIIVVGTRRSDITALTSTTPVDVVSAEALQSSGAVNLSAALQKQIPSFHFTENNPSVSVQFAAKGATLHGLGPDQVLVLINGVRLHLNSQVVTTYGGMGRGAQFADIDIIPVAGIGSVEVLRDGASAQYGSDAIAGVVNITLKKKTDGVDVRSQVGTYSTGGGTRYSTSAAFGLDLPRDGYLSIAAEAVMSDKIDIGGVDTRQYYFAGDPREATIKTRHWFFGNGKYNKFGFIANGELPLSEKLTAFSYATASTRQNYGFANFRRPLDDGNVRAIYPDGFQPVQKVTSKDYDVAGGLRYESDRLGTLSLTAQHGYNEAAIYTWNSLNASLGAASPTGGSSGVTYAQTTNLTLDQTKGIDVAFMSSPLTVSSGLAYRHESYEIEAGDPFSYTNGGQLIADGPNRGRPAALGSQGASGFQPADEGTFGRDVAGGYIDLEGSLFKGFDLGLAGRSEHYSDFGWTTNGKLSARYAFNPMIALRGTVSTGLRAPSIGQLSYQKTTGIFVSNVQFLQRILQPTDPAAAALGAKPLKPEKSNNISLGLVFQPQRDTVITIDTYQVKVDDRITLTGSLTGSFVSGILARAGFPQLQGAQFFTNALDTKTEGVDVLARKTFRFENSKLELSAAYAKTTTKITHIAPNPTQLAGTSITLIDRQQRGLITSSTPDNKIVLSGSYSFGGGWVISPTVKRYGTYTYIDTTNTALDQTFDPQWITDLNIDLPPIRGVQVSLGVNNLFRSYPEKVIPAARNPIVSEYPFLAPEGAYGSFYYLRAGVKF
jgi:iron complex outermembrane receptor protein